MIEKTRKEKEEERKRENSWEDMMVFGSTQSDL